MGKVAVISDIHFSSAFGKHPNICCFFLCPIEVGSAARGWAQRISLPRLPPHTVMELSVNPSDRGALTPPDV